MNSRCTVERSFLFGALGAIAAHWAILGSPAAAGEERIAPIAVEDFARLLAEIKPQPGESPWREIPWLTDISEARRRAVAEDKPLVIFTAADGSPLGRT